MTDKKHKQRHGVAQLEREFVGLKLYDDVYQEVRTND
jgi:hypothetical protein